MDHGDGGRTATDHYIKLTAEEAHENILARFAPGADERRKGDRRAAWGSPISPGLPSTREA
jgi:hypothetical protein